MREADSKHLPESFLRFVGLAAAAAILRVRPVTMRRLVRSGSVPAVLFAGAYLIDVDVLLCFKQGYDSRQMRSTRLKLRLPRKITEENPSGYSQAAREDLPDGLRDWIDAVDAAEILGMHSHSLRRLIRQSRIPVIIFLRKYLIREDVVWMLKANYNPRSGRSLRRAMLPLYFE